MSRYAVLLMAAGKSSRFGDPHYKKPFAQLNGREVWLHSAERFLAREDVCQVIVVIAPEDREEFQRKFAANLAFMDVELCEGGSERSDSVRAGLERVGDEATHVAVHDAARPCVTDKEIDNVFAAAARSGAAILATPITATLKRVAEGMRVAETVPRDALWAAQTPQAFEAPLLREAHMASGEPSTDDAQLVERLGRTVSVVEGSPKNLKITTKQDLQMAELVLQSRPRPKPDGARHPFEDDDLWR